MPNQEPRFIDNPHAPETFATEVSGFFNLGGSIVLTLETLKSDYGVEGGEVSRVVVHRLVMPAQAAHSLAVGLFDFLKKQGFDPADSADAPSVQ